MKNTVFMRIIRWTARILSTLLAVIFLLLVVLSWIEIYQKQESFDAYNVIQFTVLGIGLAALILAWWKEGLGGIISFISIIVFNLLSAFSPVEGSHYPLYLLIFLFPSILYLLFWLLKRNMIKKESQKIEHQ
jgi:cytochrome bd-type quinol oxidase subunit 2